MACVVATIPVVKSTPTLPQPMAIDRTGTWLQNAAESSGFVWNNELYYVYTDRNLSGSSTQMKIVKPTLDGNGKITGQTDIATFGLGYGCQDALVDSGTLYVFATNCKMDSSHRGNTVVMFKSTNLTTWTGPTTIKTLDSSKQAYNVAVTKNSGGYTTVSYDTQSSAGNVTYFLWSNDYTSWGQPGGSLAVDGLADMYFLNGRYYIWFTDHLNSPTKYGTNMLYSTNLTTWNWSRIPVLWPGYYAHGSWEDINTTDFDATEFNGRVYIFYLTSDQSTYMRLTYAIFNGSMAQYIEAMQQPN